MIKKDKKWIFIAALIIASIWVTQLLSQPIKLTIMVIIYLIIGSITYRKFLKKEFIALMSGIILSFLWWGVMIKKYSLKGFLSQTGGASLVTSTKSSVPSSINFIDKLISLIKTLTNPGGTASRAYTFNDFFIAKTQNMINNPIGIGWILSILALIKDTRLPNL